MRFLLYNIRYGTGGGPGFHFPLPFSGYLKKTGDNLKHIAAFIKSQTPDIIGLIEVDSGSYRSIAGNQAELIARELGHYCVYQSKYSDSSFWNKLPLFSKQGNAFLTSQNIQAQRFHYFEKGIKRLVIELELGNAAIFLTHLSIGFRHRHHQLSDLYALIKKTKKPVIVAGDLNAMWGERELDLFLAATGLKNANLKKELSYPSHSPRKQLDFILHSPEISISRFEVPRVLFSDHLPILCEFSVKTTL